jgi:hypothetical protein
MRRHVVLPSVAASLMMFSACSRNDAAGTSKQGSSSSGPDVNDHHTVGAPPAQFTYFEIYEGNDGKTHFRDITVDLKAVNFAPPAPPVGMGEPQPATRTFFTTTGANWGRADYEAGVPHPTPKRQFVVALSGTGAVITTDGDRRRTEPGTVVLLTDVAPSKGHFTIRDNKPSVYAVIQLE